MPARRAAIRAVPAEPDALADLTPPAKAISADGDLWCWQLNGISALGVSVEPAPPFGE